MFLLPMYPMELCLHLELSLLSTLPVMLINVEISPNSKYHIIWNRLAKYLLKMDDINRVSSIFYCIRRAKCHIIWNRLVQVSTQNG